MVRANFKPSPTRLQISLGKSDDFRSLRDFGDSGLVKFQGNEVTPLCELYRQYFGDRLGFDLIPEELTPGQRRRILEQIHNLQQQYDLIGEKIEGLRVELVRQVNTVIKFQLEQELVQNEAKRDELVQKIEELENRLKDFDERLGHDSVPEEPVQVQFSFPIKILFLTANPSDQSRLRLGQELRDIRERLQLSQERDRFVLESRESVRPGDITQAIFDVKPQIVHFSGHGENTGELCFENLQGKVQPVQPDALAALFELVADQINCVVLNACHSEAQAKAIAEHIPYVIGISQEIGDPAAIEFAIGFYDALAAERSIEVAYKLGCFAIELAGIPESSIPVLKKRN